MEVSLARVVVRSANGGVTGWWLGDAVRCGWLAGSLLRGSGCAARAGGSGRCPWGCPPWGPVPWSRVLCGSRSLALGAVAMPSSSSGACEVALVVAGSSPGGEGVVVGCAAVFPVASSVGVARSPRAGVPSLPCVVSGGCWACAGVIRMASDSRLGGVCCGRASPGVVRCPLGVGGAGPTVVVCPSCVWVLVPAVMSSFPAPRSLPPPLPGPWVVSCSHVVSLPVPCPYGRQ